jgi:hypothetical protein
MLDLCQKNIIPLPIPTLLNKSIEKEDYNFVFELKMAKFCGNLREKYKI